MVALVSMEEACRLWLENNKSIEDHTNSKYAILSAYLLEYEELIHTIYITSYLLHNWVWDVIIIRFDWLRTDLYDYSDIC